MGVPTRWTSGFTQAAKWQPLGNLGIPDPFFYATYEDDFLPYNAAEYTVTAAGGTVAATAANGSGGRILFTTGAVAGNWAEIQLPVAGLQYTAGKKLSYLARIQVANITTSAFIVGLINTDITPFTAVADGIYFNKVAGSTNLVLTAVTSSVVVGTATINVATSGLTNATDIDLGIYVSPTGSIFAFVGSNLEGAKRQDFATLGPTASILGTALTGALTAVLLNPTIAVSNGATAAPMTAVADFQFAAQER